MFDRSEGRDGDQPFYWSSILQSSFREELEKCVLYIFPPLFRSNHVYFPQTCYFRLGSHSFPRVLLTYPLPDYLMLNTDRGADNYMIKYCEGQHEKSLVDIAPSRSAQLEMPMMKEVRPDVSQLSTNSSSPVVTFASPPRITRTSASVHDDYNRHPHIHIAAIDNSLSFPHEHPKGWRSYTYGWLYLPVSVIGKPFSPKTRDHFLPFLTSKAWWEDTSWQLRELFRIDPDFNEKMFLRQLSVIKGQAWNIVQSLRHEVCINFHHIDCANVVS